MLTLSPATLTASGRPALEPGEVERMLLDKVDLEFEGRGCTRGCPPAERYQGGYAIVTSRRLFWMDATSAQRSAALPLAAVASAVKRTQITLNLVNPKVRVELQLHVDASITPVTAASSLRYITFWLRCRGDSPDAFMAQLKEAATAAAAAAAQQQQQQQLQQQQAAAVSAAAGGGGGMGAPTPTPAWPPPLDPTAAAAMLSIGSRDSPRAATAAGGGGGGGAGAQLGPLSAARPAAAGGGGGGGGGMPPRPAVLPPSAQVDQELLRNLLAMGFPRNRCVRALLATPPSTTGRQQEAAVDWLLAYGDAPGMDEPLLPEEGGAAAGGGGGLGVLGGGGGGFPGSTTEQRWAPERALLQPPAAAQGAYGSSSSSEGPWATSGGGWGAGGAHGSHGPRPHGSHSAPDLTCAGPGSGSSYDLQQQQQQAALHPSSASSSMLAGGAVGVSGILAREAAKAASGSASLAAAFQDLNALMRMAGDMVTLAERLRTQLAETPPSASPTPGAAAGAGGGAEGEGGRSSGSTAAAGGGGLEPEFVATLIAMGIPSPVTKATTGSRYLVELSRQLADFLAQPLSAAGGLLQLPDVYCLFNRARGAELVSPDDLLAAAQLFQQVGVPMRLRQYASGVTVVQSLDHDETALTSKISQLVSPRPPTRDAVNPGQTPVDQEPPGSPGWLVCHLGPGVAAPEVSAALGLPLALAREALLVAEAAGVVARDDGPEGLRFYRNFFPDTSPLLV